MQEDLLGLQLDHNVAVNRTAIVGDFNAHVGKWPCGIPINHLIAKHAGCLPLLTMLVIWLHAFACAWQVELWNGTKRLLL